ncbi:unnamed protein product [Diamesa serratosioi]
MNLKEKVPTVAHKYPTYRDDIIRGCFSWLEGKRVDDNAEKLWRVHDKLYDLTDFISKHPGGSNWIQLTEGTDVTDQFETFHMSERPTQILSKYYIRDAIKPRNYKITYENDGFYKTLKERVSEKMKTVDKSPLKMSKFYCDFMLFLLLTTAILSVNAPTLFTTVLIATISGVCLMAVSIISHNFVHQKNNWRMYLLNVSLMSWRDWRVFHAMSHHMYPNSYLDLEVTLYEPTITWTPRPKTANELMVAKFLSPFYYAFSFYAAYWIRMSGVLKNYQRLFYWDELIAYILPTIMFMLGDLSLIKTTLLWQYIIAVSSFSFGVVSLNAGHHHPEIIHEGDELESLDFGYIQMGATIDRIEADKNVFTALTCFGTHTLHHLFPSIDHALLPQLKGVFEETCNEFDIEMRKFHWYELMKGQFKQLARTEVSQLKKSHLSLV